MVSALSLPLAVLTGMLAYVLISMLWYAPFFFGERWRVLMGLKSAQMRTVHWLGVLGVALVLSSALAFLMVFTGRSAPLEGLSLGIVAWFGFVASTSLLGVIFERRPLDLYLINQGCLLVAMAAMGLVIAIVL